MENNVNPEKKKISKTANPRITQTPEIEIEIEKRHKKRFFKNEII